MYPRSAKDISENESFISDSVVGLKNRDNLQLVILKKDSQEFLGCAGLHNINRKAPEIGIWLKKSAQGACHLCDEYLCSKSIKFVSQSAR